MRTYTTENSKELLEIVCNKCGKKMTAERGIVKKGVFHGEISWGFFSEKDGIRHQFDLCEECYNQWIRTFIVPVEENEETELL